MHEKFLSVLFLMVASLLLMSGCASVKVRPVDSAAQLKHVCIEENSEVKVGDFIPVVREGFQRHGISTEVYTGEKPASCEYTLSYTAFRSWDVAPYLTDAKLTIEKNAAPVAWAEYHLKGNGGLSLTKWKGTRSKMAPVIDELLKAYS